MDRFIVDDFFINNIVGLYDDVYRYILSKCANREIAYDVCQNTMMKAYESITRLKKPASYKAWIMTIASNELLSYYRKASFRREIFAAANSKSGKDEQYISQIPDEEKSIEEMLVNEEDMLCAIRALESIDKKYNTIITMHLLQGLKLKEIAGILKINYNTVRTLYARGLKELRAAFYSLNSGEDGNHETK
ncbi:MAG: RNA polymerase sigma factor [Eubacteriaceae bacterium]|jgi:RNA polymerase sigma-70 factor (ECF subfamily)|nr:RNA polymerase sigma factor [Eubacteriaceae bacterium]